MKVHISRIYTIGFLFGTICTIVSHNNGIVLGMFFAIILGFIMYLIGINTKRKQ